MIILIFIIDHFLILLVNPASISEAPTSRDSMEMVHQFAGRSIGIFAIVLVVIEFTMERPPLNHFQKLTLAALTISAGFLMVTFILELFGSMKILFFRLQLTSLRYSGLLLFTGLYLLLESKEIPIILTSTLFYFTCLSWIAWIIHELHYIFQTQRKEWNRKNIGRCPWVKMNTRRWVSKKFESLNPK